MTTSTLEALLLASAVSAIERKIPCVEWTPDDRNDLAPTGERYMVLSSGGATGSEAVGIKGLFLTAEAAIDDWSMRVREMIRQADQGARLYWRIHPEIDSFTIKREMVNPVTTEEEWVDQDVWFIYSRFLISALPELEQKPVRREAEAA